MSKVTLAQIERRLLDTFSSLIPKEGISNNDPEIKVKVLTRCLAAYAVKALTDCSNVDAANSVVDGGDDNGLDAIYYSQSQNLLLLCQSKWKSDGKGEPDSADILKFCTGIKDLIDCRLDRFNERVAKKQTIIHQALQTFNCKILLVITHTSAVDGLAKHSTAHLETLLNELNDAAPLALTEVINQSKIYDSMLRGSSPAAIDLELSLIDWGKIESPHTAFYGTISGDQIARWWTAYGENLFERNLRSVLGSTDINQLIATTIVNDAQDFWYFNNGITVTAKSIDKTAQGVGREFGVFRARGANIVNGAQTVSTIGGFTHDPERLKQVRVPIRIISLENAPTELGAKITKYTNTQNRIEARDFVSQDPVQIRIRSELSMDGIEYNLIRRDSFSPNEKSFDLEEATTAMACTSGESELAVAIKTGIGRFWADTSKTPYTLIFNGGTSSYRVFNSVSACRIIDNALCAEITKLNRTSGPKYSVMIHGNRFLATTTLKALRISTKLDDQAFSPATIQLEIEKMLIAVIDTVLSIIESQYSNNFLAVLFKSPAKSEDIMTQAFSLLTGGTRPAQQLTFEEVDHVAKNP